MKCTHPFCRGLLKEEIIEKNLCYRCVNCRRTYKLIEGLLRRIEWVE